MKLLPLAVHQQEAESLLASHRAGAPAAIQLFHQKHPRFLDEKIPWLPKRIDAAEIQSAALDLADAQLAVARVSDFLDWPALVAFTASIANPASPIYQFEASVEAVVDGDVPTLTSLLQANPALVHARSTRITHFDPPVHRATLLHYLVANGTEGYRQRTPANAVEVAKLLLAHGADPNATASLYGGECGVMSMLVSSSHPAQAGVQIGLIETLADFGASVEPLGTGNWHSPLVTALVFGFQSAAEALLRRGARLTSLPAAAGLGRLPESRQFLPAADAGERHVALALAAQLGQAEVVKLLLDAGEDPKRFNPPGTHQHSTPLHQAALAGHESVVRLLVERGARLDTKDTIYQGTPLGWAEHGGQTAIAKYLRSVAPKKVL
jgi:ankyrin repeat protein